MTKNKNKLYNYLVNTYGISKEVILEYTKERIEKVLEKTMADTLNSNYFNRLVENRLAHYIKNGFESGQWGVSKTAFDDYIKGLINTAVNARVREEFEIEVKIVPKDASIIRKAKK